MANRKNEKRNQSQQKKQDFWVILIICVIALAIVGVIVVSKLPKPVSVTKIDITPKPMQDGFNLGDPNAPVKVIEFADFQCPYCMLYWQQVEPTILSTYVETKKVYYTYSPMAFLGQESIDAAQAVLCANDQNQFWAYRDYLFSNHTAENAGDFTQAKLLAFAKNLSLDEATFKSCLTSGKYATKVTDLNNYAAQQGINSTPSFLVNGKIYNAGNLQQGIDDALAGK